jgi:Mrp family chromosome partitioning ATPase
MLEALRALETRQVNESQAAEPAVRAPAAVERSLDRLASLTAEALAPEPIAEIEPTPAPRIPQPAAPFETCTLPTARELGEHYVEMAARICEQQAATYCNVMLVVGADRWVEPAFSIVHLAQAFAEQSVGDVLLVDGDLRWGRLSKMVSRPGPGMIDAMTGRAKWPDIIHPTDTARIDFVARGNGQVPTFERPEFGWGALRPLYRVVLIGLSDPAEPETTWLAGRCDTVYFVLSRPHTRRGTASAAINALRASGANVVGSIVVND